jgi:hypothetical protein
VEFNVLDRRRLVEPEIGIDEGTHRGEPPTTRAHRNRAGPPKV